MDKIFQNYHTKKDGRLSGNEILNTKVLLRLYVGEVFFIF
jgi:hypothetical protein